LNPPFFPAYSRSTMQLAFPRDPFGGGWWALDFYRRGELISHNYTLLQGRSDQTCEPLDPITTHRSQDAPVNVGVTAVAVADLSRDGHLDLATANSVAGTVSVLLGRGDGTFAPAADYVAGLAPQAVVMGDFNGDGATDIAVANRGTYDDTCGCYPTGSVSVLLNDGTGRLGAPAPHLVGGNPQAIVAADFNGDGVLDLATANKAANDVSILIGTGGGSFGPETRIGVGEWPVSIASGDFNEDGRVDLAVAAKGSGLVSVLIGDGAGGFVAQSGISVGGSPTSVLARDFDGNGHVDLVVGDRVGGSVSVLHGQGDGSFLAAGSYSAQNFPAALAAGDLNEDGTVDVAAVGGGANGTLSLLLAHADGRLEAGGSARAGSSPRDLAVGDFDEDGTPDFAVANAASNDVTVLLNSRITTTSNAIGLVAEVGTVGLQQTIVIASRGTVPIRVDSVEIIGTDADAFLKASDSCLGQTIASSPW
jgi:FG-GAP-like repeat